MSADALFTILLNHASRYPNSDTGLLEKLNQFLLPVITVSHYPRQQLLLSAGQVADYLYFLEEGLARGFYFDEDKQKEITNFLWQEQSIIIVPVSFYSRKPSPFYIEVTAGTQLLSLSYYHLLDFIRSYPEAEIISRNLVLQHSEYEEKRNHDLSLLTAWDRYVQLLEDFPLIEQQVSKEVIASYLHITPQSLSRMLREKGHP